MSVGDQLVLHVKRLDEQNGDASRALIPKDAAHLVRLANLHAVGELIEEAMREKGLSMGEVIRRAIAPNRESVCQTYPFIERALDAVIRDFGANP